jgi:peptide methionine sulfoxide reductase MsrB|eukprot:Stramenopile-MAST_4_protein_3259
MSIIRLLSFVCVCVAVAASAEQVTKLVTFDGATGTTYKWKDLNDPVMGGQSVSTWHIDADKSKTAVWDGEVKIVPSLKAPGFCNAETTNWFAKFADVSAYTHLLLHVRTRTPDYRGYKVSFSADTLNVQFHSFKAMFNISQANVWETVSVPFEQFSNDWSAYTGRCDTKDPTGKQHHCCSPEHPEVCPTKKNLRDISEVGLWTEGVAGKFHLEIAWIGAGNVTTMQGKSPRNVCHGPVQKQLRYNVSGRLARDYLPDGATPTETLAGAVCCDPYFKPFAEPNGFYARPDVDLFEHVKDKGPTIFYDSVCGLPLFRAPQNRTVAEFKAESAKYGWPSFRKDEIVGSNVRILSTGELVSACGTHLGSNQPDELGDRFCTDLVCLSGNPV